MDIKSVLAKIAERPWLLAAALILGYFIIRPGRTVSAGFDPTATLQSQQISSAANIQMAGIAAGMRQTDAANNAVVVGAMRDVLLGAQQYAALDKTLSIQQSIEMSRNTQAAADTTANVMAGLFDRLMGHKEAVIGLRNQADTINNSLITNRLGFDLAKINSTNDAYSLETDRQLGLTSIDANKEMYKFGLPFNERMNQANINGMTQLSHDQIKIARAQGSNSIFNNLLSGFFGLANKGVDIAAVKGMI